MAASTAEEWALAVISAVVLVSVLSVAVHRGVQEGPRLMEAKALLQRASRVMCARMRRRLGESEPEVLEKLHAQRVHHMRFFFQFNALFITPFTVEMLVTSLMGRPRAFSFVQDIMTLAAQVVFTVVLLRPATLNQWTVDAFYGAVGATAVVGLLPPFCGNAESLFLWTGIVGTNMTIHSIGRRDFVSVATFRLVYLVVTCCAIWAHGADCITPVRAMVYQLGEAVIGVIVPCLLDVACYEIISQGLEINSTKQLLAAASALLKSLCDAIVELSEEGVIVGNPQELSAILLRRDGHSLVGRRFAELLAEETEQQLFAESLATPLRDGQSLATTLNVSLRDANGSLLRSQVMWFPFSGAGGAQRYMLGVRDLQAAEEEGGAVPVQNLALPAAIAPQVIGRVAQPAAAAAADAGTRSDGTSSLPSRSPSSQASSTEDGPNSLEAVLAIDQSERLGFLVRQVSQGFLARAGRISPGVRFLDYLEQPNEFAGWLSWEVTEMVNTLAGEEEWPRDRAGRMVTLIMPHGRVEAVCKLSRLLLPEEDEEDFSPVLTDFEGMELTFSHIRLKRPGNAHHSWRRRWTMRL